MSRLPIIPTLLAVLMLSEPCLAHPAHEVAKSQNILACENNEMANVNCQNLNFSGKIYRFPVTENLAKYFGTPPRALEVTVPTSFWTNIFHYVDPKRWPSSILQVPSDGAGALYITLPDDLFQWSDVGGWPKPPVRGPFVELKRADNLVVWRSRSRDIPADYLYITFQDRSDIYAQCNDVTFNKAAHYCDVNWFDGKAIHMLGVPADWLHNAPDFVDAYQKAIGPE
jgi:hypothetical protein